ncbi:MAG: hypothetical protein GX362_01955 [Methanosarcinaceae archaeon]|nr:hypothetical protein [Methanosarcinaceae archaeon]
MYSDAKKEQMKNYKCKNCGGAFLFDPVTQKMKCERCGTVEDFQDVDESGGKLEKVEINTYDFNLEEHKDFTGWADEIRVYRCSSCGATTTLDKYHISTQCPFCGSSQVQKTNMSPGIKPEYLIPFQVTQTKAEELFKEWIRGQFFAKSGVKQKQDLDRFKGVYLPFWNFDAFMESYYKARLGFDEQDSDGNTSTRWRRESGTYARDYSDVQVTASETIEHERVVSIYPYNMKELRPYDMNFLSGFTAERYSIGAAEGFETAKSMIDSRARSEVTEKLRNKYNPDRIEITSFQMNLSNVKYKHILAPVWVSAFTYNGKTYRFLINGQTGKVDGKFPISWLKVAIVSIVITLVILIVIYIFMKMSEF